MCPCARDRPMRLLSSRTVSLDTVFTRAVHSPEGVTVKKKFLLANKHITKYEYLIWISAFLNRLILNHRLNSTLILRIEELNAEISTLQVENLRLRASQISLLSQLQREREKTHRVMVGAENAVRFFAEVRIEQALTVIGTWTTFSKFLSDVESHRTAWISSPFP